MDCMYQSRCAVVRYAWYLAHYHPIVGAVYACLNGVATELPIPTPTYYVVIFLFTTLTQTWASQ